ncbi:hypothetical protein XELAEV_18047350mg [Xenopus laevis]|uniref:Trafficking kinesin-binding protein C-terminal domain-containing protein n=1 Tax=Xenopus laevis TaxID=8355 RepID=A0A974H1G4_XENLA|nr:hypothetical protein XELAEV_18047350mg [Xenopus laevis]
MAFSAFRVQVPELQDRNAEIQGMLQEYQDELKMMRHQSCSIFPVDSLAAEIEGTMRRDYSMDKESCYGERKSQPKRVFDKGCKRSLSYPLPLPIPGSNHSGVVMTAVPFSSNMTEVKKKSKAVFYSGRHRRKYTNPPKPEVLENSLEVALHRLHLRRQNYIGEKRISESSTDSVLSVATHHSDVTEGSATSSSLRSLLPEKLQIVKPLEELSHHYHSSHSGSQTLFHWQQLAQPNLGTVLDPRPGVMTKDFQPLPEDTEYNLCDLEEDEKDDDEEERGIMFLV